MTNVINNFNENNLLKELRFYGKYRKQESIEYKISSKSLDR